MVLRHIVVHTLLYTLLVDGYLLLMMVAISPRVWGYSDYSEEIRAQVPPQTAGEKRLALWVGIPWMVFSFGYPLYSAFALKAKLGGDISYWTALLDVIALVAAATLGDLVLLDWLVVSKITPRFVVIPGTVKADYADFSHHYRAHARSSVVLVLLCAVYAGIAWLV